jgi:putative PIN family toxin of toxin-antitoxin system
MTGVSPKRRIVLDTNVFVSSLFSRTGTPNAVVRACFQGDLLLVVSDEQRAELDDVLQRPQILSHARLTIRDIADLNALIQSAELIEDAQTSIVVRDAKDQPILAAALRASVDFLVTGDADLLVLADDPRIAPLRIVTPRAFLTELGLES